jgi:hypothetical protein
MLKIIDAILGQMPERISLGDLAELLASVGIDGPDPQKLETSRAFLRVAAEGGVLLVSQDKQVRKLPDGWERWITYSDDPYAPGYIHHSHRRPGQVGEWQRYAVLSGPAPDPLNLPAGVRQRQREEVTYGPDMVSKEGFATFFGLLRKEFERLGLDSPLMLKWLGIAADDEESVQVPECPDDENWDVPQTFTTLDDHYEFYNESSRRTLTVKSVKQSVGLSMPRGNPMSPRHLEGQVQIKCPGLILRPKGKNTKTGVAAGAWQGGVTSHRLS